MSSLPAPLDLTRLIGAVSQMADRAPNRRERKRLRRLVADLCSLATALSLLDDSAPLTRNERTR